MLLRCEKPIDDETMLGYLIRLANANEYLSPSWIIENVGKSVSFPYLLSFYNYARSKVLPKLEKRTLYREDILAKLCYKPSDIQEGKITYYDFYTQCISRHYLRPDRPKMCPECLKENPYYRKIWDLLLITSCPKHGCVLIEKCPNCNSKLNWFRSSIVHCKCGFDFRNIDWIAASKEELMFSSLAYNLCDIKQDSQIHGELQNTPLFGLGLENIITALVFIGSVKTNISRSSVSKFSIKQLQDLINGAMPVFLDWPKNYYSMLSMLVQYNRTNHDIIYNQSIIQDFRGFYSPLYQSLALKAEELRFLKDDFEEYVTTIQTIPVMKSILLKSDKFLEKRKFISRADACEILGITKSFLKNLSREGKIIQSEIMGKTYVDKESVDAFMKLITANVLPIPGGKQNLINIREVLPKQRINVINAIINGQVIPFASSRICKIDEIFFPLKGIAKKRDVNSKTITENEAAKRLGYAKLRLWSKAKLIKPIIERNEYCKNTVYLLDEIIQAEAQKQQIINMTQAAEILKVHLGVIRRRTDKRKIVPVAGPEINGAPRYWYSLEGILEYKELHS